MQVQAIILECMLFLEEMFDNKRPQNNGNGEELIKMNATTHDAATVTEINGSSGRIWS